MLPLVALMPLYKNIDVRERVDRIQNWVIEEILVSKIIKIDYSLLEIEKIEIENGGMNFEKSE